MRETKISNSIQLQLGHEIPKEAHIYEQDPSTVYLVNHNIQISKACPFVEFAPTDGRKEVMDGCAPGDHDMLCSC